MVFRDESFSRASIQPTDRDDNFNTAFAEPSATPTDTFNNCANTVNLDAYIDDKNTLLTRAINQNNFTEAEDLLKQGADPNKATPSGRYPIFIATILNNPNVSTKFVKLLLDHNADPNGTDNDNELAINAAAREPDKRRKSFQLLISAGANPFKTTYQHKSALDNIYQKFDLPSFDIMLDHYDKMDQSDNFNLVKEKIIEKLKNKPLEDLIEKLKDYTDRSKAVTKILKEHLSIKSDKILLDCLKEGNESTIKNILSIIDYEDAPDNNGLTLLHHAAINGNAINIIHLVEAGADVNAKDHNKLTVLDHLFNAGHKGSAAEVFLENHGAEYFRFKKGFIDKTMKQKPAPVSFRSLKKKGL